MIVCLQRLKCDSHVLSHIRHPSFPENGKTKKTSTFNIETKICSKAKMKRLQMASITRHSESQVVKPPRSTSASRTFVTCRVPIFYAMIRNFSKNWGCRHIRFSQHNHCSLKKSRDNDIIVISTEIWKKEFYRTCLLCVLSLLSAKKKKTL